MNKQISPEGFFESFAGQDASPSHKSSWINKNTARALALTAAVLLSGCATTGTAYNSIESNNNNLASQGHEVVELREINSSNFDSIIENADSGLYKDPYMTDNVATFKFFQDPNAEETIISDLESHGLDVDAYHWQEKILDIANEHDGRVNIEDNIDEGDFSRHAQDPIGIGYDINLSHIDVGKNGFGMNEEILAENPEFKNYSTYFVMMHEVAHGFDWQQMNLLDFGGLMVDNQKIIEMENGADFAALVMTMQLMNDKGESLESMNKFMDRMIEKRSESELGYFKSNHDQEGVSHATSVSLKIAKQMFNENSDSLLNMEKPDIIKGSEIVAVSVVGHDYTKDITDMMMEKSKETGSMNQSIEFLNRLQDLHFKDPEGFEDKIEFARENFKDKPIVQFLFEHIDDNRAKFVNYDNESLKILVEQGMIMDIESKGDFSIMNKGTQSDLVSNDVMQFPVLKEDILNQMLDSGIVHGDVYSLQSVDHDHQHDHKHNHDYEIDHATGFSQ